MVRGGAVAGLRAGQVVALPAAARHTTDAEVQHSFDAGQFLRTHVLRPTWHFVTPGDIRWLLRLTGPRVHATNAYAYRRAGLDDGAFAKAHFLLAEALDGGAHRTRQELADVSAARACREPASAWVTY